MEMNLWAIILTCIEVVLGIILAFSGIFAAIIAGGKGHDTYAASVVAYLYLCVIFVFVGFLFIQFLSGISEWFLFLLWAPQPVLLIVALCMKDIKWGTK